MKMLAIDPGPRESAYVLYDPSASVLVREDDGRLSNVRGKVVSHGIVPNDVLLHILRAVRVAGIDGYTTLDLAVIEQVASYGAVVSTSIFQTVRWAARFEEALDERGVRVDYLGRVPIKVHITGRANTKDSHVNAVLKGRYGGDSAKGTKAKPGPLYGVSRDVWAALAVAVAYTEGAR